ncbi:hypothetical protein Tco_0875312 [Tanacetum coccineum]|uniref:Reverse transcriptase domain-containing protein n=1 Tax=Tanacetum coccineum TaxID=301880 RepID=A0ABQ5BS27_9ASTR
MTITRSGMTPEAIEELVNRRVEEALAAHEATRAANALETKNQSQNGSDGDNGNGGNGNGRNENPDENGRGDRPVARECTYQDFMKCQPLNFKGTEGVVGLIRWFEKMETVFHISNCLEKSQVKYATCTLLDSALTWWNSHKRTIGTEAAFSMSWRELMKLMTERFKELTMMCTKMVPEEEDQNCSEQERLNNNYGNNRGQQPPHKRQNTGGQNVARAYMAGSKLSKVDFKSIGTGFANSGTLGTIGNYRDLKGLLAKVILLLAVIMSSVTYAVYLHFRYPPELCGGWRPLVGCHEDDETEDGPVDYPMDGGDDGDDDDGDSSRDDANDEDEVIVDD